MKHITTIGLAVLLLAGSALAEKLVLDEKFGLTEKVEVKSYEGKTKTVKVKNGSAGRFALPFALEIPVGRRLRRSRRLSGSFLCFLNRAFGTIF